MSPSSPKKAGKADRRPVPLPLALTLGDPAGIGPEVALKAAAAVREPGFPVRVLIGARPVADAAAKLCRLPVLPDWDPAGPRHPVSLLDPGFPSPAYRPGRAGAAAARAAAAWIAAAAEGCLLGRFGAMVTAPICKEGLEKAGIPYPGHTEMLASLTGARRFAMLLAGGPLRVVLATRHLPLARVAEAVTAGAIREAVELTAEGLPWLGFPRGRIAVCALNPHAGDGGLLGSEEREVIIPEIRALRRRGFPVDGPVPADVVFHQALRGRYAAIVALYHDQGLGPLKMLAFDTGVNVTLGLPIARTSPDHGTAFDLAWKGKADPGSMREALLLAAKLARRPNPWLEACPG